MITANESTLIFDNKLGYRANITFKSTKSKREFNSLHILNDQTQQHDLEYYIYPSNCFVTAHYIKYSEYTSDFITSFTNDEYCIVNDIGYDEQSVFALIDLLTTKYNKIVHYNNKKDSAFSYRLSRVLDIFPACRDPLHAYFLVDHFYDLNRPKVIKIRQF